MARTPKKKILKIGVKPVKSSAFAAIGHDAKTNTLRIDFHSGHVAHYSNFTAEKHAQFQKADSLGRYFIEHIRNSDAHEHTRIDVQH